MSYSHPDEPLVHNLGGGDDKPLRLVTDGQTRLLVKGSDAVFEFTKVVTDLTASDQPKAARLFFRLDPEGKWQMCVSFPSGVTQVVVTEP
jgi:hypothetical protein